MVTNTTPTMELIETGETRDRKRPTEDLLGGNGGIG